MGYFVVYILKNACCLSVFFLFYKLLLAKETFHQVKRFMLFCCLILSAVLPLFQFTATDLSGIQAPVLEVQEFLETHFNAMDKVSTVDSFSWKHIIVLIYFLGVATFIIHLVVALFRLAKLLHLCRLHDSQDGIKLLVHQINVSPISWMNYIILSESDLETDSSIILEHEKAHIRCGHSYDQLLVALCCILQWFNPVVWWLKKELEDVHEYEADEWVLDKGFDAKTYQLMLLRNVAGLKYYTVVNNFNRNSLKKRIVMMQSRKSSPCSLLKCAFILPVTLLAVTAFARPETIAFSRDLGQITIASIQYNPLLRKITHTLPGLTEPGELLVSQTENSARPHHLQPYMNSDGVYQLADEQPRFPGDVVGVINYLNRNIRYPEQEYNLGHQGRVIVQFVVDSDGTVRRPVVVRSVCPSMDQEALRVVSTMPRWIPGKVNGVNVPCFFTLPVTFKIQ